MYEPPTLLCSLEVMKAMDSVHVVRLGLLQVTKAMGEDTEVMYVTMWTH